MNRIFISLSIANIQTTNPINQIQKMYIFFLIALLNKIYVKYILS